MDAMYLKAPRVYKLLLRYCIYIIIFVRIRKLIRKCSDWWWRIFEGSLEKLREHEERIKQQHSESQHRERVLVRRLAAKEQELQDCMVRHLTILSHWHRHTTNTLAKLITFYYHQIDKQHYFFIFFWYLNLVCLILNSVLILSFDQIVISCPA